METNQTYKDEYIEDAIYCALCYVLGYDYPTFADAYNAAHTHVSQDFSGYLDYRGNRKLGSTMRHIDEYIAQRFEGEVLIIKDSYFYQKIETASCGGFSYGF